MTGLWIALSLASMIAAQEYKGCFRSSPSDPDLPTLVINHASSPSECVRECRSRYFMFAGLMNGQQCYCGSNYGRNGPSLACTVQCATESDALCGSSEAISVYATGQRGPSPPRRVEIVSRQRDSLEVAWEPPDIPNGELKSYTLRAEAVETHARDPLPPVDSQVEGGTANGTVLHGLHPGTRYNVSVYANNALDRSEPGVALDWTRIGPPEKPATPRIIGKNETTVTVLLSEGSSEYGPVSAYQVVVVHPGTIPPTEDDVSYPNYDRSNTDGLGYYVTGEFDASDFHRYKRFTVGDGRLIGGYYNVPLDLTPRIGLAVLSRTGKENLHSYSDLTADSPRRSEPAAGLDTTAIGLCVAIALLGALLLASILVYFALKRRHRRAHARGSRLPEQQELTLQGPVYEVDNMAYVPEDVPERRNHYQELKQKVWNIPKNFLTIDAVVIRRGRFGTVHTGTVLRDGTPSSVTVHSIADGQMRASEKRHMLRELDVCIRAGAHRHLAGLVGTCETPDTLYVVTEMPPQTLKNRLLAVRSAGDGFPADRLLPTAAAVASALDHLESRKIVHDRLCARSVYLVDDWTAKLAGHGIARHALEDVRYARWTALECFGNEKKQQPAVVWAFGVLLWEILTAGATPYASISSEGELEDAIGRGVRLSQPRDVPDPLYEVMLSCWQPDPRERPTFEELVRLDTLSVCPLTAITEPYIPELELN